MKYTKRETNIVIALSVLIAITCVLCIIYDVRHTAQKNAQSAETELTQDYSAETIDPAESVISDDTTIAETTAESTTVVEELTEAVTECHQSETVEELTEAATTYKRIETEVVAEVLTECKQLETTAETTPETEVVKDTDVPTKSSSGCLGTFLIVGYCPACNGSGGYATASGVYPQVGVTAAMNIGDMKRLGIRLGDRVYIDGFGERIIQDTGCGKGKIDLWCSCCSEEPKVTKGVWVG